MPPDTQIGAGETIGERLRRLRLECGFSQRELSSPGVSYAYISRIEAGTRQPSVKALRMLARKLGVAVEYLETGREVGDDAERELRLAEAELRLRLDEGASEGEEELRRILDEAQHAGDRLSTMRARAALGFQAFHTGRHSQAIEELEAALAALTPSPAARPDLYATLGQAYALAGRPERAVELFRTCLRELAEHAPEDMSTMIRFSTYLSYALSDLGDLAGAQTAIKDALAHTQSISDPYTRVRLYWSLARLATLEGRSVTALTYVRRAISLLETTDDTLHLARAHALAARILLLPGGDAERAGDELERAESLLGAAAQPHDIASMCTTRARLAAETGDAERALVLGRKALEQLAESDADVGHAWWAIAVGHSLRDEIDEAEAAFRQAAALLSEQGHARDRVEVHRAWGRALASAGRDAAAAEVLGRAER